MFIHVIFLSLFSFVLPLNFSPSFTRFLPPHFTSSLPLSSPPYPILLFLSAYPVLPIFSTFYSPRLYLRIAFLLQWFSVVFIIILVNTSLLYSLISSDHCYDVPFSSFLLVLLVTIVWLMVLLVVLFLFLFYCCC